MTTRAKRAATAGKPGPKAERLTEADMERHALMLGYFREAQQLAGQAQQLQGRANDLMAAYRVWAEELHGRYELDANAGEGVNEDGTLVRAEG